MALRKLISQVIRFGLTGVIATAVDYGLLLVMNEMMHIDVIISSAAAFSVSAALNYFLSMKFVFKGRGDNRIKEFAVFIGLSIGGLLINQIIMLVGVRYMSVHYLTAKAFAVILVPIYNFVTRKIFLETANK